ncbi:hypothetical protein FE257_001630 [Aspergillus nanangensis]|uniref:Uncharacterized protein n=1 Tax=Aspergillus nanangensis TaxID=2582783 RepID=A0AAD4CU01_ASPNN|nr:hypothetical protein FE257_001630 [Aspergillus nanangensis]
MPPPSSSSSSSSSSSPENPEPNNSATVDTRACPPTVGDANQRALWTESGYHLPPTDDKPAGGGPLVPTPTRECPPAQPIARRLTRLYTLSYLVFFSIWGTLARLGLQALTNYPYAPVITGVLWANVGGSLLMGFFLEDKNIFQEEWGHHTVTSHSAANSAKTNTNNNEGVSHEVRKAALKHHKSVKKTIPLYIGLTTGFCGSFTSFSSFIRDVFLALTNALPDPSTSPGTPIPPRNGGYSFMALIAVILITVSLSMGGLMAGAHLALALDPVTPTFPFHFTRRILDPFVTFIGWGCWLGAIFLAIWPPDRHLGDENVWRGRAVFALVFAPLGCIVRYYVSLALNSRILKFPLGTFAVNVFGTIVLAMCFDLQRVGWIGANVLISCQVLEGVIDGFCGTVTTVSTWVAELNGLGSRRYAYLYGVVSIAVGLAFFVVIAGSLGWTKGFVEPICK